jgi:hypothetical protein
MAAIAPMRCGQTVTRSRGRQRPSRPLARSVSARSAVISWLYKHLHSGSTFRVLPKLLPADGHSSAALLRLRVAPAARDTALGALRGTTSSVPTCFRR